MTTLNTLLVHHKKYGLDNSHTGYRGAAETYTTWRRLEKDSLVEFGIRELGEESFVLLIEGIGYDDFRDAARAAWHELREDTDA